jgi:CheY-like chemotaxis protein
MTANAFAEERTRCLEAGMDDHLPKPVVAAHLHATLARWMGVSTPDPAALSATTAPGPM